MENQADGRIVSDSFDLAIGVGPFSECNCNHDFRPFEKLRFTAKTLFLWKISKSKIETEKKQDLAEKSRIGSFINQKCGRETKKSEGQIKNNAVTQQSYQTFFFLPC